MGNVWCWIFTCPDGSANEEEVVYIDKVPAETKPFPDPEYVSFLQYVPTKITPYEQAVRNIVDSKRSGKSICAEFLDRITKRIHLEWIDEDATDVARVNAAVAENTALIADYPDAVSREWAMVWAMVMAEILTEINQPYNGFYRKHFVPNIDDDLIKRTGCGMGVYLPVLATYLLNGTVDDVRQRMQKARGLFSVDHGSVTDDAGYPETVDITGTQGRITGVDVVLDTFKDGDGEFVPYFTAWRQSRKDATMQGGGEFDNPAPYIVSLIWLANDVLGPILQGGRRRRLFVPHRRKRRASRRTRTHRRRPAAKRRGYHGPRQRTAVAYYHPVPYM